MQLWIVIAIFVVVDIIVLTIVLPKILARRAMPAGVDLSAAARLARQAHEEIGGYLQANYGGGSASLPGVLQGVADLLQRRASETGITIDRDTARQIAVTSVIAHKAAKPQEVREALQHIA